jgi:NAD-dependent dihydropyrimidine dehydrogenase PreA subunit
MIEFIVEDRCTGCNKCVEVCPTNVLAIMPGELPLIARQDDCETCYMCELYCPHDAIYVGPDCEKSQPVDKDALVQSGLLGEFRRNHGWDEWAGDPRYINRHWQMENVFLRARDLSKAARS